MGTIHNDSMGKSKIIDAELKVQRLRKNLKEKKRAEVLFQRIGAKVYAITVLAGETYWSEVPVF